jgi:pimeloyl-ACP methyl ester carboxylesterase
VRYVLVHSPLVGPATWRWVAAALAAAGHEAEVPDLRAAARTGEPRAFVAAAVDAIGNGPATLVGHSGAGFFLPAIAEPLGAGSSRLVFVDAGLPPCAGQAPASADFLDRLRALAIDGVLPRWSTWWAPGAMEALVPDGSRRATVESELPEIPLAFYESPVDLPAGWCERGGTYILLSEPYRHDADLGRSLGWPVIELPGQHLDIVCHPEKVARALVEQSPA